MKLKQAQTGQAEVKFDQGGSTPTLDEIISAYPSSTAASSVFSSIKSQLDACKATNVTADGKTITLTLGQLSVGSYGDASDAWQYAGSYQGFDLSEDEVLVLKGKQICGVAYGDIGSADVTSLQDLVGKAVAKLA